MSALPPKADIDQKSGNVRFAPIADIGLFMPHGGTRRRAVFYRVTAYPSMGRGLAMRLWRILMWLSVALAVSACAENANHLQTFYLDHFATPNPTLSGFTVCHGFYCAERSPATIEREPVAARHRSLQAAREECSA